MQTYYDFLDFLGTLSVEQTLWLAIFGLLILTIGICLGWLIQRRKTSKIRQSLSATKREMETYRERVTSTDEEQKALARELVNLTTEKDDILVHLREVQHRNGSLGNDLQLFRADNDRLTATNQSYATTIEDLNDQIIGLKTRNEQLLGGGAGAATDSVEQRLRALEIRVASLAKTEPTALPPINTGEPTHQVRIGESLADVSEPEAADFTRISGIDNRVSRALRDAGIQSWTALANTPTEEIGAILYQADLDDATYDIADWQIESARIAGETKLSV
ncbi:putative flap endonuclease-1-like 5' DNA nuclease/cell division protein FtsB [Lewinella aquimaris]|uniref:Putative flap endonuclease-1-like 5' DNA nuclease/cell division protein FtsB n=1 Tax=Neolewinella aquimaris TaxID=1835722 RepID=A0A840ED09_9BACT|nr:hypothetical protein [Neolewinella aquimaris]MBB4078836.1 putative flap endonuclease-1-like 5' DNA nuclease/cell division protein FtsB [Neolewinella aquimaris]